MSVNPCPCCGRPANQCWIMPCLGLEVILAKGERAVRAWVKRCGGTMRNRNRVEGQKRRKEQPK